MPSDYTVVPIEEERESFAPYRYKIFKGRQQVAIYCHNYRGEPMKIQIKSTGFTTEPPFGRWGDILEGGGGGENPIKLTKKVIRYLEDLIDNS